MEERNLLDLTDVLNNTPGINVDYTDSERLSYNARGFSIDALQLNGLTYSQAGAAFVQPDTALLDRVEILRGASGMLCGSGNLSASVNMVLKRPTRSRVVAVKDVKESFQLAKDEDREVLYGVVQADLGARTTVTASMHHTDLDATGAWGGLPGNVDGSALNLRRNTYLGVDWNTWNRFNDQAQLELEHRFDDGWTVRANAGYTAIQTKGNGFLQSYVARTVGATDPHLMTITTAQYTGDDSRQQAMNVIVDGPFQLFGRKHSVVLGGERVRNKSIATRGVGNLFPQNIDMCAAPTIISSIRSPAKMSSWA